MVPDTYPQEGPRLTTRKRSGQPAVGLDAQGGQTEGSSEFASRGPETTKPPATGPPLRSAEAAKYINMSDSWLRQSRMDGRTDGPAFVRAGARSIRYRVADLDRWLEQRTCIGGGRPQAEPPPPTPKRAHIRKTTQAKRPRAIRRRA
jgi:predicted DNA-binding transcriptional regulator AlpA